MKQLLIFLLCVVATLSARGQLPSYAPEGGKNTINKALGGLTADSVFLFPRKRAIEPTMPMIGRAYFENSDSGLYFYNGAAWVKISTGTTGVSLINTGYGILGGPISSTGTLVADTGTLFSNLIGTIFAGTGISFLNRTIVNTAPDQTVVLNNGSGISVTGTYPNFTITNTGVSTVGDSLFRLYNDTIPAFRVLIENRVKYTDTAGMLAGYARQLDFLDSISAHWSAIIARVKYTDTAGMLAGYAKLAASNIFTGTTNTFVNIKAIDYKWGKTAVLVSHQYRNELGVNNDGTGFIWARDTIGTDGFLLQKTGGAWVSAFTQGGNTLTDYAGSTLPHRSVTDGTYTTSLYPQYVSFLTGVNLNVICASYFAATIADSILHNGYLVATGDSGVGHGFQFATVPWVLSQLAGSGGTIGGTATLAQMSYGDVTANTITSNSDFTYDVAGAFNVGFPGLNTYLELDAVSGTFNLGDKHTVLYGNSLAIGRFNTTMFGNWNDINPGASALKVDFHNMAVSMGDLQALNNGTILTIDDPSQLISANKDFSITGAHNLLITGYIASNGARASKAWLTDLDVTNTITGSISGNAATVTTNANMVGDVTSVGNTTTIATVNATPGTYTNATVVVNAKGQATLVSSGTAPVTSVGVVSPITTTGGPTPTIGFQTVNALSVPANTTTANATPSGSIAYDDANTASALVKRDASGNFSAGTITAALSGNASTATALLNSRTIYGNAFNGTADVTGNIGVAYLNSGTSASSTTFWNGSGAWTVPFTLTTSGSSGAATFSGGTLNIPTYSGTSGTVTSVTANALSPLFTASVSNPTTTPSISYSLSSAGAYTVLCNTTNASAAPVYSKIDAANMMFGLLPDGNISSATNWNTAYNNRIGSFTTTGSSGAATFTPGGALNVPTYTAAGLGALAASTTSVNAVSLSSGVNNTVPAAAGTLTGATLNSTVTTSSLTVVGVVTSGTWSTGAVIGAATVTLGSDANFDIWYRNSGVITRLAAGTDGNALVTHGTSSAPTWTAVMTNPLTTNGDIIYGVGSTPTRLAIGGANTVLHGGASAPAYSVVATGDIAANAVTLAKFDNTNSTANRPLMSGASASPTWANVTYPNSASPTAGKVIISDGSNWVASTPSYPNSSVAARKILISDGTNYVASAETYQVPGTSGNIMTSDGTNWTSAPAPTGTIPSIGPFSALVNNTSSTTTPAAGIAYTTTPVGSTIVTRTSDANSDFNNIRTGKTDITSAGGTTTLTVSSTQIQNVTGSLTQTIVLPLASTVYTSAISTYYYVFNGSTSAVTVQANGGTTVLVLAAGTAATFTAVASGGTEVNNWKPDYGGDVVASGKKLTVNNTLSLTGTDGETINVSTPTSGKIMQGNGTDVGLSTPTWPTSASSSGKIVKSDGTNLVMSTETYANPGASGNVMRSDGTNWTSANIGAWDGILTVSGSDVTTTNATLTDITGLVTGTLAVSTYYEFEAKLFCNSTSNAGTKYGTNVTVTPTQTAASYTGATSASSGITCVTVANNTGSTAFLTTASQDGIIIINGWFKTAGTGSPVFSLQQLKVTSGTAKVYIGSVLKYRKIQ